MVYDDWHDYRLARFEIYPSVRMTKEAVMQERMAGKKARTGWRTSAEERGDGGSASLAEKPDGRIYQLK